VAVGAVVVVTGVLALTGSAWAIIIAPASATTLSTDLPTMTGSGAPGNLVNITAVSGATFFHACSAPVQANGTWSCTSVERLRPGTWDLSAEEVSPTEKPRFSSVFNLVVPPAAPADTASGAAADTASGAAADTASGAAGDLAGGTAGDTAAQNPSDVVMPPSSAGDRGGLGTLPVTGGRPLPYAMTGLALLFGGLAGWIGLGRARRLTR
jgi:hypothetical protein